jgi:hypothetical protein
MVTRIRIRLLQSPVTGCSGVPELIESCIIEWLGRRPDTVEPVGGQMAKELGPCGAGEAAGVMLEVP